MPHCPPEHLFGHRLYVCGINGCTKTCSTRGGVKWHLPAGIHPQLANCIEAAEADQYYDFNDVDLPWLDEPNTGAGQHPQGRNMSYHPLLDGTFDFVNTPSTSTYHCMQELHVIVVDVIYHPTLHHLQTQVPLQMTIVLLRVGQLSNLANSCTVTNRCQPQRSTTCSP